MCVNSKDIAVVMLDFLVPDLLSKLAEPFSDMPAPFREWTGGSPHRHGPLSRAQYLRTSASYRWWYLVSFSELFSLLWLSHCVEVSLLPRCCRVGRWHVVHNAVLDNFLLFSLRGLLVRLSV